MCARTANPCGGYSQTLSAGATFEEILTNYPFLVREDILAAIEYAAVQTDHIVLQSKYF
jgi:uncharacterized protein (DUF433 family)